MPIAGGCRPFRAVEEDEEDGVPGKKFKMICRVECIGDF